jgi:cytochrome c556
VSALQRDFVKHGEIQQVDDLEAVAIKLRTFADKVRTAPRGYSGLFDAVNKNEAELQRLYEFDAALLELADEIDRAIDNVETSVGTDGLPAAIRHLETSAQLCVDTYNQRENVFLSTFSSEDIEGEV